MDTRRRISVSTESSQVRSNEDRSGTGTSFVGESGRRDGEEETAERPTSQGTVKTTRESDRVIGLQEDHIPSVKVPSSVKGTSPSGRTSRHGRESWCQVKNEGVDSPRGREMGRWSRRTQVSTLVVPQDQIPHVLL